MQLLPAFATSGALGMNELIDLPAAPGERVIHVLHGQVLELPWLVPFGTRQLVEAVPFLVKLVWKLLLVLARFLPHIELESGDRWEWYAFGLVRYTRSCARSLTGQSGRIRTPQMPVRARPGARFAPLHSTQHRCRPTMYTSGGGTNRPPSLRADDPDRRSNAQASGLLFCPPVTAATPPAPSIPASRLWSASGTRASPR